MRIRKYYDELGRRVKKKPKSKKKRGARRSSAQKGAALEGLLLMPMDVLQMVQRLPLQGLG